MTENFRPSQLRTSDLSPSLISLRSECFSTGFNARVIAHLKHSSSSFLRLTIAFFAARNDGSKYKRNRQVVHTLPCEDPDSKLNAISNYFPVLEIFLMTRKQFLSYSKQFVRVSTF